jgi:hypothetical protein
MPLVLARRPRDRRGYPITAVSAMPGGIPDFGQIDQRLVLRCAVEDRCGLCGTPCDGGLVAFLGGPLSDLDDPLAGYGNPPMDPGCAEAAVRLCPYIAYHGIRQRHHDHQSVPAILAPPAKPDPWVLYATRAWTAVIDGIAFPRPSPSRRLAARPTVTAGSAMIFRPGPPVRLRRFGYDDAGRIHGQPSDDVSGG